MAPVPGAAGLERLRAIPRPSPRAFAHARSSRTPALLAETAQAEGPSVCVLSIGTIRQALLPSGGRAGGAFLGFADAALLYRSAQPALHAWAAPGEPLRLAMHAAGRSAP